MKRLFILLIFILLIDLTFHQCANPGRPTGGPKDTIPPTLIYSSPITGTTNFSGEIIEMQFSEYINADKLKQQLIITPRTNLTYKSLVKRNRLILKLNSKLNDSTTYNFNFANGITDITEKNPAINLSLAFSTGPYIDSMWVKGSIEELMTKEPGKGYVVGLYPFSDTLDFFTQNPMYFTTANDSGTFQIEYIKTGNYKVIAFDDDNKNLLLDPETESHGFLADTIQLDTPQFLRPIRCILQNVKPIKLINARPTGPYVEVKYNKQIDSYQLYPSELYHNIIGENKDIIRIYKPKSVIYNDSIQSILTVSDSLGNVANDSIKYVFIESNRKPASFSFSFDEPKIDLIDNPQVNLSFNKPIIAFDTTKFSIHADSTFSYPVTQRIAFNENRTKAKIQFTLNADSLNSAFIKSQITDSTNTDSTQLKTNSQSTVLSFSLDRSAFISVEADSSTSKSIKIEEPVTPKFGTINLSLNTEKKNFTVQLIDGKSSVAYSATNKKSISFSKVKPASYKIRILIDSNNDNNWSYGNLLKNTEPEEVFLYPDETSVRENWVIDLGITF